MTMSALMSMSTQLPELMLQGRVLEAIVHWIHKRAKVLDGVVPLSGPGARLYSENFMSSRRRIEQASYQGSGNEILIEFIYTVVIDLLGRDAVCLASSVASMVVRLPLEELMAMIDGPQLLLALFVRKLEEIQSKLAKAVVEIRIESGDSVETANECLRPFFKFFTVNTSVPDAVAEPHETGHDPGFAESQFQICLIDSYGSLMELLAHVEKLRNDFEPCVVVDFEGKASPSGWNRYGELCLMQITVSDQPLRTYVIDIHLLREKAFSLQTPNGTSLKVLLEDQSLLKVWWDCRNDVDVLWNHFEILPNGVFDLQLAEVAKRRCSGIEARFVQGLQKALTNSLSLQPEQRVFAELIDVAGKKVYEPNYGGNYEMFKHRPLHPHLLIYAAHDTRYQLLLHSEYRAVIGDEWSQRVLEASLQRSRWGLSPHPCEPSREAPEF